MNPIVLLLSLFFLATPVQDSKYDQGMQKAFELWGAGKNKEAINLFERIEAAEPEKWQPAFYVAQITVLDAFSIKDETELAGELAKAQDYINRVKSLSKDNPDVLVLEAQYYTAWVAFDGQKYGMMYAAKVDELYKKALQLDPDRPTVVLAKAQWDMGSAAFFGKSTDPYCAAIERAIALSDTYQPAEKYAPRVSKEYAQQVLAQSCRKSED
ncbi:hypothetical protein [Croceiramulus getboli]|nr:hypothetical protein P8624_03920 [Flavobacteriaceae bacterium YJPT1-3]